jgi:hypothetical protein
VNAETNVFNNIFKALDKLGQLALVNGNPGNVDLELFSQVFSIHMAMS